MDGELIEKIMNLYEERQGKEIFVKKLTDVDFHECFYVSKEQAGIYWELIDAAWNLGATKERQDK